MTYHERQSRSPARQPGSEGDKARQRRKGYSAELPDIQVEDPALQEALEKLLAAIREREGTGNDKANAFITVDELVRAGVIAVIDGVVTKAPAGDGS